MVRRFFSIYDGIFMYSKQVMIAGALKERIIKRLPHQTSRNGSEDKSFNEKLCFLSKYEQRNRRKCKILQRLCDSSKGTTKEIYPMATDGQTLVKVTHRFCRSNEETLLFNSGRQFLKMARSDEM